MHTLSGGHHLPHAHSQAVTTYPPTCTHSQAVTTLHMHKLSGSHHPPHAHTLRQSLPSCDILPRPHGSSPRPCDPVPQTMLPYHVIMLPGPCDYITHNQAVTTLPHAHSQAVIHLPHAHTLGQSPPSHMHTLRQSPPSHMHTLSDSHHPPTCTHSQSPPSHLHTLRQSPPSTSTHSQAVTTLPHAQSQARPTMQRILLVILNNTLRTRMYFHSTQRGDSST